MQYNLELGSQSVFSFNNKNRTYKSSHNNDLKTNWYYILNQMPYEIILAPVKTTKFQQIIHVFYNVGDSVFTTGNHQTKLQNYNKN